MASCDVKPLGCGIEMVKTKRPKTGSMLPEAADDRRSPGDKAWRVEADRNRAA
jgi:hypothetical protein